MATEPTENPSSQNWKECFRELAPRLILYARQFVESIADAEDVVQMARRQLWLRPGSAKDRALIDLVDEMATERDGRWALDWAVTRIGIVTWEPRDPD